ncbi:MAG: hypothetical protein J6L82_05860 [Alphaproteobacteria bacterium]|nr:hypothetical protein [Alphaproteobacteria bacterium]
MKKMIYMIAFAAVLTAASTADAMVNSLVTENNNLQQQKYETTLKKACEVCPYVDQSLCASWVPNCPDETIKLNPDFPVVNPDPVLPRDPIIFDPVSPVVTTATVSSCPPGTTKSSDGCCCVNN